MPEKQFNVAKQSIIDVHLFFVEWFNGTADPGSLEPRFARLLDDAFFYIPPSGEIVERADMLAMFGGVHGTHRDFEIDIEDVVLRQETDSHMLLTYTEIQRGALPPSLARNRRVSSILIRKTEPLIWLSVHETAIAEPET